METLFQYLTIHRDIIVFTMAIIIRFGIGMRRFNRKGMGGLQHFDNYFAGLLTLAIEWLLWWAASIAILWTVCNWLLGLYPI